MSETSQIAKLARRRPIFGILSIAFPLIGIPSCLFGWLIWIPDLFLKLDIHIHVSNVPISQVVVLWFLSSFCGFISAAVALFRKERFWVLPLVGGLLNTWPFVLVYFGFHSA
jgi:hypothetical protein